jgi:hypothetical protein
LSYEELWQAGEEKDAAILELQQAAETTRAALETEKKKVEGMSPLSLFSCWLNSSRSAPDLIRVFAFRPVDGSRDVGDPGRGDPDGLKLLSIGTGGPAGSGPRGVSGHGGGRCASRELHGEPPPSLGRSYYPAYVRCASPGVQKTLRVMQSHYRVNLGALSTGYIIRDGLDDDGAEAEMNHVDALAAPAADILADDFMEILFPDAPPTDPLEP